MKSDGDSTIKVLFFYPNEFLGPEMTVFGHIIDHLDRSRCTPYLGLNSAAEGRLTVNEEAGVSIYRGKFGRALRGSTLAGLRSWFGLVPSLIALGRYAKRERIDIVQCVAGARTGTLGFIIARLAGARLVHHYHSVPGRYAGPRRFFEYRVGRLADHIVTVSDFIADEVRNRLKITEGIDVVVNGADLKRFDPAIDGTAMRNEYGIAPEEVLVLQLARIYQGKRQEDVVRACAIARRSVPNIRCLLVGWEDPRYKGSFPSYKAELEDICAREGLGEALIIGKPRPEAPELIAAADIVAMPSVDDPCPLIVIEAMASGRPVVGANSGGIPELIEDQKTGFLVQPESPEALAEKLVILARDVELRRKMGKAGRQRAENNFDQARLGGEFLSIYQSMIREKVTVTGAVPSGMRG